MYIRGPRVTLRPLTRDDLSEMISWRPFDDPLLAEANWPQRSLSELNRWYTRCTRDQGRLLCAVTDRSGQLVGSITLRERDGLRSARLGITFGADFVDQGLGTEALSLFLDYYFNELGFAKLVLDVLAYNRRAIRVYQKLGFVTVSQHERPLGRGNQWAFIEDPTYADVQQFFRRDWMGRQWLLCYDMELTRKEWWKRRKWASSIAGTRNDLQDEMSFGR
jgi:RimJ/RimL family protein N-acetyltransferase